MKSISGVSNFSMTIEGCLIKIRFFVLVVNTGNFINERFTPTLGVSHALIAPIAIFTTYIFLIVMVVGAARRKYASMFLQVFALVACCVLETSLSILVFKELIWHEISNRHSALILDGVLPMIIVLLLLADLVIIMLSNRDDVMPQVTLDTTDLNIQDPMI